MYDSSQKQDENLTKKKDELNRTVLFTNQERDFGN